MVAGDGELLVNGRSVRPSGRSLALYFFHLCDGRDTLIDPDGREIADAATIRDIAIKEARAMISQDALGGRITLDQFIEVRDEAGKLIHQTAFRDAVSLG